MGAGGITITLIQKYPHDGDPECIELVKKIKSLLNDKTFFGKYCYVDVDREHAGKGYAYFVVRICSTFETTHKHTDAVSSLCYTEDYTYVPLMFNYVKRLTAGEIYNNEYMDCFVRRIDAEFLESLAKNDTLKSPLLSSVSFEVVK